MGVGHAVLVAVARVDAAEYGDDWSAGAESTEESADLLHDMLARRLTVRGPRSGRARSTLPLASGSVSWLTVRGPRSGRARSTLPLASGSVSWFPSGNIHKLYTRAATSTAVLERVAGLRAGSEDLVVLYVTCHGGYRTLSDRREQALYLYDRKLGLGELASLVRPLRCRCVVIADACHTGEPPVAAATARALAHDGREVLYYGAAVESTDGNLFTRLLTRLAPVADDYRDLATRLQAALRASGGLQEPVFFADRASGSFVGSKPFAV